MQDSDAKHLSTLIERQAKTLERIAAAVERSNELLFELLSPEQRKSLAEKGTARAVAELSKSQKAAR